MFFKKIITLLSLSFFVHSAHASGYLFVAPQSLNLSEANSIAQLHLVNKSDVEKTYKVSLKSYYMNEKGALVQKDFEHSALKNVRYAPRRVTLGAGEDQYVNVSARFTGMSRDDERHVHIEFTEIENAQTQKDKKQNDIGGSKAAFSVGAAYGVAVPVFVTKGTPEAQIALQDFKVKKSDKNIHLTLDLKRSGESTAYAKAYIDHIAPSGKVTPIGVPVILKLYRETLDVEKSLNFAYPKQLSLNSGRIKVTLKEYAKKDKKDLKTLSEKILKL